MSQPKTPILPRPCGRTNCTVIFTPKKSDGEFCSRVCANFVTQERRKARKYQPQSRVVMPAHFGPPLIPPQAPPLCHGQALDFGSDPTTGRSTQYCPTCGERPLQRFGVVTYPQRPDFEQELEERFASSKKAPAKSHGKALRWQEDFQVVSKAMRDRLENT